MLFVSGFEKVTAKRAVLFPLRRRRTLVTLLAGRRRIDEEMLKYSW